MANENTSRCDVSDPPQGLSSTKPWHGAIRRYWGVLAGAAFLLVCFLAYREIRGPKKLAQIRAALADYESRVQSYSGSCGLSYQNPGSNAGKGQSGEHAVEFAVDRTNGRFRRESRERVKFGDIPGATFRFRRVASNDGGTGYNLVYSRSAPQIDADDWGDPHRLAIGASSAPEPGPSELLGLSMRGAERPGLLKQIENCDLPGWGRLRYEGVEKVNGAPCDRVTIDYGPEQITFWFDPHHGYLPRRQKLKYSTVDVFEFQSYRDEKTGEMQWFPSHGRIVSMGGVTEIKITELKINPTLDQKQFQIDAVALPDGVQVVNAGGTTYTGGREDLWKENERLHEKGVGAVIQKSAGVKPEVSGPQP